MRKAMRLATLAFAVALVSSNASWAELRVQADKENVVASRLEGEWTQDAELTQRLGGGDRGGRIFKNDPAVAAKVPARYDAFFKGKQVYTAGMMTLKGKDHPFVLIEHKGNPHIVYFREANGDPLGDAESFNVMLAPGKDKQDDLLFIGGDFNNQPFSACRRVKSDGE